MYLSLSVCENKKRNVVKLEYTFHAERTALRKAIQRCDIVSCFSTTFPLC